MTNEKIQEISKNIQEKLGEENSALILDDLGMLITETATDNEVLSQKDTEINNLNKSLDAVRATNISLFQQIGTQQTEVQNNFNNINETKEETSSSWYDFYDDKGNFKK